MFDMAIFPNSRWTFVVMIIW